MEVHKLWIMVQLLGAIRQMEQQVGVNQMSPPKHPAGGTLHPTLLNLVRGRNGKSFILAYVSCYTGQVTNNIKHT